jgi:GT2 family glycosyltransferase
VISFVIVTHNSSATVGACLDCLALLRGIPHEVVVVDNDSTDDTRAVVRGHPQRARLVESETNGGFSYGVNLGTSRASGETIFLLNPDAYVRSFDRAAVDSLLSEGTVGVIGPRVLDGRSGTRQLSARSFPSLRTALFNRYSLISRLMPNNRYSRQYLDPVGDGNETREVDWVSGCAMIFRKEVFERVGGFDERFFVFSEDVDFCLRLNRAGYRVLYSPDVVVEHEIGISKDGHSPRVNYERHRSMWLYYQKHLKKNIFVDAAVLSGIVIRYSFTSLKALIGHR